MEKAETTLGAKKATTKEALREQYKSYKSSLDAQVMEMQRLKHQGTMTQVEKAMNKHELKGYKNSDANIYSMLPGLQSESPVKYSGGTSTMSTDGYRFPTKHLCAPPAFVDNSLAQGVDMQMPRIKPPFKRGSNLFDKTFMQEKMTHDHSLDNLKQSEIRESILTKFKNRGPTTMQVSTELL